MLTQSQEFEDVKEISVDMGKDPIDQLLLMCSQEDADLSDISDKEEVKVDEDD